MSARNLAKGIIEPGDIASARAAALRAGSRLAPEPTRQSAVIALARPVGEYLLEPGISAAEFACRMDALEQAYTNLISDAACRSAPAGTESSARGPYTNLISDAACRRSNGRTGDIESFMASVRAYRDFLAGQA